MTSLHYDFSDEHYQEAMDSIPIHESDFIYEVEEDGDYEELKKKYYQEALECAAYKTMCEYADMYYE